MKEMRNDIKKLVKLADRLRKRVKVIELIHRILQVATRDVKLYFFVVFQELTFFLSSLQWYKALLQARLCVRLRSAALCQKVLVQNP